MNKTYSSNAKDPIRSRSKGVTSAAVLRREDLRSVGVQHSVHDITAKVVGTLPAQKLIRGVSGCRGI